MRANNIRGTSCFVRTVLLFVMHQIIGTEGVTWLVVLGAFLLTTTVGAVSEAWAHSALMRAMHVVMPNTPFLQVQDKVGADFAKMRHSSRVSRCDASTWRHNTMDAS